MTQRIHISIPISDLSASIAFYSGLFGHEPSKIRSDYANFRLNEPPIMLALMASPEDGRTGEAAGATRRHFGVELPSHAVLDAWRQRLEQTGLAMRHERNATCCYARADKLWLRDPDGNAWEIWVRTADADTIFAPTARDGDAASATATDAPA